jgi:hypothetical protein
MKKGIFGFGKTAYAVIDGEVFDGLHEIAKKHGCDMGVLIGVYVGGLLDRWAPDFEKSMLYFFGKGAGAALNALHLEGWRSRLAEVSTSEPSQGGGGFSTPIDHLAEGWRKAGGEEVAGVTKRRLHNQMSPKYPDGPVRLILEGARLYRKLFPEGTFQTFVGDAYRYAPSMDEACVATEGREIGQEILGRWRSIWSVAGIGQPSSKVATDPYLFLCCSLNPLFDEKAFASNLETYNIWDAMALSAGKRAKKQPNPVALMKGGDE